MIIDTAARVIEATEHFHDLFARLSESRRLAALQVMYCLMGTLVDPDASDMEELTASASRITSRAIQRNLDRVLRN